VDAPRPDRHDGGWRITVAIPEHLRVQLLTPDAWARLEGLGEVTIVPDAANLGGTSPAALAATDVLLTGWGTQQLTADMLPALPRLRAVIHTGGSLRPVLTAEVLERGIRASSQAAANTVPVAEYTLAMVILALKQVPRAARLYAERRGDLDVHRDLHGAGIHRRVVGIVGASRIGRRVIELLRILDVDVIVHDPYLDATDADSLGVRRVDLAELARTSDVVSVHAPVTPETHHMIDATFLSAMADDTTLINTARGVVVDEDALVAELRTGRIQAVLDVTDPEVPDASSPLWTLPNVVLTPHVAGALGLELRRLGDAAVEEVSRLIAGEDLLHEVDAALFARLA